MAITDVVAPTPEALGDFASQVTEVIVMRADGTQILTSTWFVQEEFSDVAARIQEIFGPCQVNAVVPVNQDFVDAATQMMTDPETKFQFNGD